MAALRILLADHLAAEGVKILRREGFSLLIPKTPGLDEPALCRRIAAADAVIVRSATRITAKALACAPGLRVVGRAGIGVDNIDVDAATERGVLVLNTPAANAVTAAELAVAHLLSLSRHLPAADRSVREGRWERAKFVGAEVAGKTVGIIGYGAVGRMVAARCRGLAMRVIAFDPFVGEKILEEDGVGRAALRDLLKVADYISLHCPLNDETRGMIAAAELRRMKPGARLINCARGGVVDEAALAEALQAGRIAGAAVDVFAEEPPGKSPLLSCAGAVFTPHLGASTIEAQSAVGAGIAGAVAAYLKRGEAAGAVNLPPVADAEARRAAPYRALAGALGRLLAALAPAPLSAVEVGLNGRAAGIVSHPIASEAIAGVLRGRLQTPVNQINARRLAARQGIALTESKSEEARDFVSLLSLVGEYDGGRIRLVGTLLGGRHPRLVFIDEYEVEIAPVGPLLITWHQDRPGVVGALGALLGARRININQMQVGAAPGGRAMAVIGIARPLSAATLKKIAAIPAVSKAVQTVL